MIDNAQPIDYLQLYAQAVAALNNNERYWLTHEEVGLADASERGVSTTSFVRGSVFFNIIVPLRIRRKV